MRSVVNFSIALRSIISNTRLRGRKTVSYSCNDPQLASNAALLFGAYLVLAEGRNVRDAAALLKRIQPSPFRPFQDASYLAADFDLSLSD